MKFMFAVTDFDMGGITSSLKNLTDELIKRGHSVSIINLPGNKDFPVSFNENIEWIELKGKAKLWDISISDYKKASGLKKIYLLFLGVLKKALTMINCWEKFVFSRQPVIDCDVAIAYRQSSICYYILKHKTTAKKTIAFIHSEVDKNSSSWVPFLKNIDCIACVSDDWSNKFRKFYPHLADKVGTVYNLFDAQNIKTKAQEYDVDYTRGAFNIVTVSRIENMPKRISAIPDIYQALKQKTSKNIKWYIVGDGPDCEMVEEIICKYNLKDDIIMVGAKKNPYPYIKSANLFVLTSKWESYGMVIQEALILGTPVVAWDYGALREIMTDKVTGLIAMDGIDSISDCIVKLVEKDSLYIELKNNAEKYCYSTEETYNQLMNMCE